MNSAPSRSRPRSRGTRKPKPSSGRAVAPRVERERDAHDAARTAERARGRGGFRIERREQLGRAGGVRRQHELARAKRARPRARRASRPPRGRARARARRAGASSPRPRASSAASPPSPSRADQVPGSPRAPSGERAPQQPARDRAALALGRDQRGTPPRRRAGARRLHTRPTRNGRDQRSTASRPRRRSTNAATLSPAPSPRRTKGSRSMRSLPARESSGVRAKPSGPSGTGTSPSGRSRKRARLSGLAFTSAASRPARRRSASAPAGMRVVLGPRSIRKPSMRSLRITPPGRVAASSTSTDRARARELQRRARGRPRRAPTTIAPRRRSAGVARARAPRP